MIRLGVICPSEIAYRRFMPALMQVRGVEFAGIGVSSQEERFGEKPNCGDQSNNIIEEERKKAQKFTDKYGGRIFESYREIACAENIDALYIPLPPALHYMWANIVLGAGKHVLIEKPATVSAQNTSRLIRLANSRNLAVHENYMFVYHRQLREIERIIQSGEIGEVRLYRITFGFPKRPGEDFRYNRQLGGGAFLDAGGYAIKYASQLLGESSKIKYAQLNYVDGYDVDMYGSGAMTNDAGDTVQIAFGMDNAYRCELEVWGSEGMLTASRVLTAPDDFIPTCTIYRQNDREVRELPADHTFKKSIEHIITCMKSEEIRTENYRAIMRQAGFVDEFLRLSEG